MMDVFSGRPVLAIQSLLRGARLARDAGENAAARSAERALNELAPRVADMSGATGQCLRALYDASIQVPHSSPVRVALGHAYFSAGHFDHALACVAAGVGMAASGREARVAEAALENVRSRVVERWHFAMLNDRGRNVAYAGALDRAVKRLHAAGTAAHVMDVGAGTGLLSLFAMRVGADTVVACEQSAPMAGVAADTLRANGAEPPRVRLLRAASFDVRSSHVGPAPTVVVSELVDAGLLGEGAIPALRDVGNRLAARPATAIPAAASLYVALVEAPGAAARHRYRGPLLGRAPAEAPSFLEAAFDTAALNTIEPYTCEALDATPYRLLSAAQPALAVDFLAAMGMGTAAETAGVPLAAPVVSDRTVIVPCTGDGVVHAVALWFTLHLDAEHAVSSAPGRPDSAWEQALFFLPGPRPVAAGRTLAVRVAHSDDTVLVRAAVAGGDAQQALPTPLLAAEEHEVAQAGDRALRGHGAAIVSGLHAAASGAGGGGPWLLDLGDPACCVAASWFDAAQGKEARPLVACAYPGGRSAPLPSLLARGCAARGVTVVDAPQGEAGGAGEAPLLLLSNHGLIGLLALEGALSLRARPAGAVHWSPVDPSGVWRRGALEDLRLACTAVIAAKLPATAISPFAVDVVVQPVSCLWVRGHHTVFPDNAGGVDATALHAYRVRTVQDLDLAALPHTALAEPVLACTASVGDMQGHWLSGADWPGAEGELELPVTREGPVDAVAFWFVLRTPSPLGHEARLCTGPADARCLEGDPTAVALSFRQAAAVPTTAPVASAGDILSLRVRLDECGVTVALAADG